MELLKKRAVVFLICIGSYSFGQKLFPTPYLVDGLLTSIEVLSIAYDSINEVLYQGSRHDTSIVATISAKLTRFNAIDYSVLAALPEVSKTGTIVAIYALAYKNDTLFIGGDFDTFGGLPRKGLAAYKISTNSILSWAPDPAMPVKSLLIEGNYLYVGLKDTLYAAPFLPDTIRAEPFELKRYIRDASFTPDSWIPINHLPYWGYTKYRDHWQTPSDSYQYKLAANHDHIYYLMNGFPLIIDKATGFTTTFFNHINALLPGDYAYDIFQASLLPLNGMFLDFVIHNNKMYVVGDLDFTEIIFDYAENRCRSTEHAFDLSTNKLTDYSPGFNKGVWCHTNLGHNYPSKIINYKNSIITSGFIKQTKDFDYPSNSYFHVRNIPSVPLCDIYRNISGVKIIQQCDSTQYFVATDDSIGVYQYHFTEHYNRLSKVNGLMFNYKDRLIACSNNVVFFNAIHAPSAGTGTVSVFCLPIDKSAPVLSVSSTTICPNSSNIKYTVLGGSNYIKYTWHYTGSGITLTGNGTSSLSIDFSNSATSGTLSVYGTNYCNDKTDSTKLFIHVISNPIVTASFISPANCFKFRDTITVSSPSPVDFNWSKGFPVPGRPYQSLVVDTGIYKLTATHRIYGCLFYKDYRINSLAPNKILPLITPSISCASPTVSYLASSLNPLDSITFRINSVLTSSVNPAIFGTTGPHKIIINNPKFLSCADTTVILIVSDKNIPNAIITSHSYADPFTALDTITCLRTSIHIVGATDTASTVINWRSIPGNVLFSNPIDVNTAGNYKLIVKRTDNFCADSSIIVFITQSGIAPDLIVSKPSSINCSISTATLNATTSYTAASLLWTTPSFTSANPATISVPGKYYVTATRSDNGCTKKDSVTVNYSPTLLVKTNNDTVVCKNTFLNLTANVTGTLSGITYVWDNGSMGKTVSVTSPVTTKYIVTANSPSGCLGKDTVIVYIPADIKDSIVVTKNCNEITAGSITIFAKGGISPFYYSVNESAYSSQNTYTNLPYGTFNINIKDAIDCRIIRTVTIDKNSGLPKPTFIASTQNAKGDTVVLVDLTSPKPDSVHWHLPNLGRIVGGDNFNPLVVFADTGSYHITLDAFYTDCKISMTKLVHIAPMDTAFAKTNNKNGIKSIVLFPNPNSGFFTTTIEFYKKQNVSVQVWDAVSVKYFQENFLNADYIELPINLFNISNGTYILKVIGEYQSRYVPFVISR